MHDRSGRSAERAASVAPTVAVLSPCGWGNLGDAAIVDSVIQAARKRLPHEAQVGLTLNPRDTAERHGIAAYTCCGYSLPHYGVSTEAPFARPEDDLRQQPDGAGEAPTWRSALHRIADATRVSHALWTGARMIRSDRAHRQLLAQPSQGLKWVIVAGGGQLDDFWGGAFGHPYVLFRWSRAARQVGAKFLVLSVGTGSLDTPLARYFVEHALEAADYRSFRDEGSRALVQCAKFASDRVVPDLAYGLAPASAVKRPRNGSNSKRVGFSPIAYCDPRIWPEADEQRYRSYVARMAQFGERLLRDGYELVLYGTDGPDWQQTVDDLKAEIRGHVPELIDRVIVEDVRTHQQLFSMLDNVVAVVASRLHGVILAHLMGVPVLALSYQRKVDVLMKTMSMSEYCLAIDQFTAEQAVARFGELVGGREAVSDRIDDRVSTFRNEVERQYDEVLAPRTGPA